MRVLFTMRGLARGLGRVYASSTHPLPSPPSPPSRPAYVDLHCHWIASIDDGARSVDASLAMLVGLKAIGFGTVIATPHMRPGMFDNDRALLEGAFAAMQPHLDARREELPRVGLASEHFLDDVVFTRLVEGKGLPYPVLDESGPGPRRRGVLVELGPQAFPPHLERRFFDLGKAGLRPVLAHPERYAPVWKSDRCLDPLLEAGAALLLDVCALVGKYGRAAEKAARALLDDEAYEAACSDAHRPEDVEVVARAIDALEAHAGTVEARRLLHDGPRRILGTM